MVLQVAGPPRVYYIIRQDIVELVPQAWGCLPWDMVAYIRGPNQIGRFLTTNWAYLSFSLKLLVVTST